MQGVAHSSMNRMIKQFEEFENVRYCISTYSTKYLSKLHNDNIIYNDFPVLHNTEFVKAVVEHNRTETFFGQIFTTFKGCDFLKNHYQINDNDLLIKCRTNAIFNLRKLLSKLTDNKKLYTTEYRFCTDAISDYLFCANFSIIYGAFKQMMRYIEEENIYTEDIALFSIEKMFWAYLQHNGAPSFSTVINMSDISPCTFRTDLSYISIDEYGIETCVGGEHQRLYTNKPFYINFGTDNIEIFQTEKVRKISQPLNRNLNI